MIARNSPIQRLLHAKFTMWLVCVIIQTMVVLCFMNIQYGRMLTEKSRLEKALEPLGCLSENWSQCLRAVSGISEKQLVFSNQLAVHREAAVQRARQGPTEYKNIRVFRDQHPALVPLDPRYTPSPDWDVDIAIPDIAIVGLAKAGTTQLFRILTSHPDATNLVENKKEFCLPYEMYKMFDEAWDNEPIDEERTNPTKKQLEAQKVLWNFHRKNFFSKPSEKTQKTQLSVNGCYHNWDTEINRHYLLPFTTKRNQKYIVLFRDPADLLWSAFNFWKIPGVDPGNDEGWAEETENYRSPELFHELLVAGNRTHWWGREVRDYYRIESVRNPRKLLGMFGAENVLFLRNEDMLPAVVAKERGVLDRVSEFTGLTRDGFDERSYSSVANCNDKAMRNCGGSRSSAYRIAGNRDMLPESRTLIYLHFLEECKIWKQDFGIEYPACLNILEQTKQD